MASDSTHNNGDARADHELPRIVTDPSEKKAGPRTSKVGTLGQERGEEVRDILTLKNEEVGVRRSEEVRDILTWVTPVLKSQQDVLEAMSETPAKARGVLDSIQQSLVRSFVDEQRRLLDVAAKAPADLRHQILDLAQRRLADHGKLLELVTLSRPEIENDLTSSIRTCADAYRDLIEVCGR